MGNPFKWVWALLKHEPAIALTIAGAGIGTAASLGLHLNPTETKDVYAAVAALTSVAIRQSVQPSSSVAATTAQFEKRLSDLEGVVNRLVPAQDLSLVKEVEAVVDSAASGAEAANTGGSPVRPVPVSPETTTAATVAVEAPPSPTPTLRWKLM